MLVCRCTLLKVLILPPQRPAAWRLASAYACFEAATLTCRRLQAYACTPTLVPLAVLPAHCPLHFVAGSRVPIEIEDVLLSVSEVVLLRLLP
jgi:hypothetical protein